jgi:diguanylate cyclase (GGDEF)-like protein
MSAAETDIRGFADDDRTQDDLRKQISAVLTEHADVIAADTGTIFPFDGGDALDPEHSRHIGLLLVQLLCAAVKDGGLDRSNSALADLIRATSARALRIETLFSFSYLMERTAIDELALDQSIGATSEPWPIVAQLVRRASFDLLGAYAGYSQSDPGDAPILDRLTTLYSRAVFDAALAKVVDRAGRFGDPMSVILFDIDRLADINQDCGYGVGDRVLERLGILIKAFFRQHDWIARYSEDGIAVILSRTEAEDATDLAERVRRTVQERLELVNHRSDKPVHVTVSAGVVNIAVHVGDVLDPERIMSNAETALSRAKELGRNRVERFDAHSRSS